MAISDDIKQGYEADKLVIGSNSVLKSLRAGKLSRVVTASNCDSKLHDELKSYCEMAQVEFIDSGIEGKDLGAVCKKSFGISVLGFVS